VGIYKKKLFNKKYLLNLFLLKKKLCSDSTLYFQSLFTMRDEEVSAPYNICMGHMLFLPAVYRRGAGRGSPKRK
jgi:hypothetical protein